MVVKQEVSALLNKKMDRKDFLKMVGVVVVAATGVGTLLRTVRPHTSSPTGVSSTPRGYGSSPYGGSSKTS